MSLEGLEAALASLPDIGTPVKVRPYRQVWHFPLNGRTYYLKWYPRKGHALKRLLRGDPAFREYQRLLTLQHHAIPAPRAVAYLSGMLLGGAKGDGVLTAALEGTTLDHFLHAHPPTPRQHRDLTSSLLALTSLLAESDLGHPDLHLGNFLIPPPPHTPKPADSPLPTSDVPPRTSDIEHRTSLFLLDAYPLRPAAGMRLSDLLTLAASARAHGATRSDLLRGWKRLGPPPTSPNSRDLPPLLNPINKRRWRKSVERYTRPSAYTGRLSVNGWEGLCFLRTKFAPPFSRAAALTLTPDDYAPELTRLLAQLDADTLYPLKRSKSADVLAAEITLAGVPLQVVVKRPFRRYPYRYVTELGRGTRAWRGWWKSWLLLARSLPTAWPLAFLERRVSGVAVDQLLLTERVPGPQLDKLPLDTLSPDARDAAFRKVGGLLRRIDDTGIVHFDTKASNFIVHPQCGPVLVDVDGVRPYRWRGEGLRRTLQSLHDHHKSFTPQDAQSLRLGYNPWHPPT